MSDLEYNIDNPNDRPYARVQVDKWNLSSTSQADTFLSRFNRENMYKDGGVSLAVGNYVVISLGGTNTSVWEIAGFDMEHNQTAADGTVYDNGYGICMIPQTYTETSIWGDASVDGGYLNSNINKNVIPALVTSLQNKLGSHLISRNVLLSSSVDSSYLSNNYIWTTSYATLMSIGQITGTFRNHKSKYDDGEANYRLPIFNQTSINVGTYYWSRNIAGGTSVHWAYAIKSTGTDPSSVGVNNEYGVRPMIYIR